MIPPYKFPKLVIKKHEDFFVVRDDLLEGGSKRRFIDRLIREEINEGANEFVYGGCPANGYAQLSLTLQAKAYGKKAVFFMAKRSLDNLHPYQKQALEYGADIRWGANGYAQLSIPLQTNAYNVKTTLFMAKRSMSNLHDYQKRALKNGAFINWVPNGMLQVTKKRALDYYYKDPVHRRLLQLGLDEQRVKEDIRDLAKNIEKDFDIDISEVWSVGSSGTLTRGLQMAFPDKDVHCVSVGHTMSQYEVGRAVLHRSDLRFTQEVKEEDKPPFPSVPTYDAKAWKIMREKAKKGSLFWNVAK